MNHRDLSSDGVEKVIFDFHADVPPTLTVGGSLKKNESCAMFPCVFRSRPVNRSLAFTKYGSNDHSLETIPPALIILKNSSLSTIPRDEIKGLCSY